MYHSPYLLAFGIALVLVAVVCFTVLVMASLADLQHDVDLFSDTYPAKPPPLIKPLPQPKPKPKPEDRNSHGRSRQAAAACNRCSDANALPDASAADALTRYSVARALIRANTRARDAAGARVVGAVDGSLPGGVGGGGGGGLSHWFVDTAYPPPGGGPPIAQTTPADRTEYTTGKRLLGLLSDLFGDVFGDAGAHPTVKAAHAAHIASVAGSYAADPLHAGIALPPGYTQTQQLQAMSNLVSQWTPVGFKVTYSAPTWSVGMTGNGASIEDQKPLPVAEQAITGYVTAWRAWKVNPVFVPSGTGEPNGRKTVRLNSTGVTTTWPAGKPMTSSTLYETQTQTRTQTQTAEGVKKVALPGDYNSHGVHAFRSRDDLRDYIDGDVSIGIPRPYVAGTVALWGEIVEHEKGYRAQYGYPLHLYIQACPDCMECGDVHQQQLARELRKEYGCEVSITRDFFKPDFKPAVIFSAEL